MSRSNNTEGVRNPSTRWFEWKGGGDQGFLRWYDKEAQKNVEVALPFKFLLLDELATVKGWHEASQSNINANEVRDTSAETLLVRAFKGGEIASGFYKGIRDRIIAQGGYFHASLYIAYKDGDVLKLGNLGLNGAALAPWMEFKKNCPTRKDATGKSVRGYYVDAVTIDGYTDGKKGSIKFRTPTFSLSPVGAETNQAAIALDKELQDFLSSYFSRRRVDQTPPAPAAHAEEKPPLPDDGDRRPVAAGDGFEDDDIPF